MKIWTKSLKKYEERPSKLDNTCLVDFVTWYTSLVNWRRNNRDEDGDCAYGDEAIQQQNDNENDEADDIFLRLYQSLVAYARDIQTDSVLIRSDYLAISETWMNPDEPVHIGFKLDTNEWVWLR